MANIESEFEKEMSARGLSDENTNTTESTTELQTLKDIIRTWREMNTEVSELNSMVREKKKRLKALEEVILRIMKKNTIGALDLTGSGGRLIYRRQNSKGSLNLKSLSELLTQHLKSDKAAEDALKYISEHRGAKVREKLVYEKD